MSVHAGRIGRLLAEKHSRDVFVAECKDGPSHGGHRRMDAWVMAKSWSKPLVTVYEIKVSRSDFIKDEKWHNYLPLCNKFVFVCPHGLIAPEEIPQDCGLMWVSKTGNRLFTKRKAVYRDVVIPNSVFIYILMWRVQVCREHEVGGQDYEYWKGWLEQKEEKKRAGHEVTRQIGKLSSDRIAVAEMENSRLKSQIRDLEGIKVFLEELQIAPGAWNVKERIQERMKLLLPPRLRESLDSAIKSMNHLKSVIESP